MGLSKKFVIASAIISFPVMLMYQNCSKTQSVEMSDMTLKASSIDTGDLPINDPVSVQQPGSSSTPSSDNDLAGGDPMIPSAPSVPSGPSSNDVGYQVQDPVKEMKEDVQAAVAACADLSLQESANDNPTAHYSNDAASGIRGNKVLSKEDFGGNSHIKSISDSFGKVVLCGLQVDSYSDSGGHLILVDSEIASVSTFHGQIFVHGEPKVAGGTLARKVGPQK